MPSAAAKKKRAALRASQYKVSKDTGCRNKTNLDDEIVQFNKEQYEQNERRRDLLQRIARRETERGMQKLEGTNVVAQSRPSGAHTVRSSQGGAHGTESHGHTTNSYTADRSSQSSLPQAESHGQMANHAVVRDRENPITLLQSTYPARVTAASTAAVQELLELLHLYEPPSEPAARKAFESEVYCKVKRILRNQKQRAYRKAKKQGLL